MTNKRGAAANLSTMWTAAPLGLLLLVSVGCDKPMTESDQAGSLRTLAAALPDHPELTLSRAAAVELASLSLACVDREYPNKPSNIVDGDETVKPPRELTPAFYGCFDWHSAVHGHWALVRVLRTYPDLPIAAEIRRKLAANLTPQRLAVELAYFELERNLTFERPYGWGWLLRLATELRGFDDPEAARWAANLEPLANLLSARFISYLDRLSVPIRSGTHSNTAFALSHALDYARVAGDATLASAIEARARVFYLQDRDCPSAYEPSGEDFISPCLAEADLMRRILDERGFAPWLDSFLPPLNGARFAPLRAPIVVKDPEDPKIGHLIGLAYQRAWCFVGIAGRLPAADPRRAVLDKLARHHRHVGWEQMSRSGYGGEHWLASFAIYLLTNSGS